MPTVPSRAQPPALQTAPPKRSSPLSPAASNVFAAGSVDEPRAPGRFLIFSKKPGGRTTFEVLKKRISRKKQGCFFRAVAQGHEARPPSRPQTSLELLNPKLPLPHHRMNRRVRPFMRLAMLLVAVHILATLLGKDVTSRRLARAAFRRRNPGPLSLDVRHGTTRPPRHATAMDCREPGRWCRHPRAR